MFKSIMSSFARSYGRQMGRTAARRTAWLAIPMLLVVVVLGILELTGGGLAAGQLGPAIPELLHLIGGR